MDTLYEYEDIMVAEASAGRIVCPLTNVPYPQLYQVWGRGWAPKRDGSGSEPHGTEFAGEIVLKDELDCRLADQRWEQIDRLEPKAQRSSLVIRRFHTRDAAVEYCEERPPSSPNFIGFGLYYIYHFRGYFFTEWTPQWPHVHKHPRWIVYLAGSITDPSGVQSCQVVLEDGSIQDEMVLGRLGIGATRRDIRAYLKRHL